MNIGEASKASKVSAKMIRYYEQVGLIPPTDRNDSGYRAYSQDDVHRLYPIRRACDFGFSVAETTDLLGLRNNKSHRSTDVRRLAQQHTPELDRHIVSMLEMAETFKALTRCCVGDERSDCPILHTLEQLDTSDDEPEARTDAVSRRASGNIAAKKPRAY